MVEFFCNIIQAMANIGGTVTFIEIIKNSINQVLEDELYENSNNNLFFNTNVTLLTPLTNSSISNEITNTKLYKLNRNMFITNINFLYLF